MTFGGTNGWGGGEGGNSFVAYLSHLTIDHAFLSARSTLPTPSRDISSIRGLVAFFPSNTVGGGARLRHFFSQRLRAVAVLVDFTISAAVEFCPLCCVNDTCVAFIPFLNDQLQ